MALIEMIKDAMPNLPAEQQRKIELHLLNNTLSDSYQAHINILAMVYNNYQR